MKYEKSFCANDWRYRSEADKIITSLFSTDFVNGDPATNDDIAEVQWFKLTDVQTMMDQQSTAEEHAPQLTLLITRYNTK